LLFSAFLYLVGCTRTPTSPLQTWGGVGFLYEGKRNHVTHKVIGPEVTTVLGFEKQFGSLGVGAEIAKSGH